MVERQPLADRIGDLDKYREPADRITSAAAGTDSSPSSAASVRDVAGSRPDC
jgi:hypothetical protein